jgi:hypothetical protein
VKGGIDDAIRFRDGEKPYLATETELGIIRWVKEYCTLEKAKKACEERWELVYMGVAPDLAEQVIGLTRQNDIAVEALRSVIEGTVDVPQLETLWRVQDIAREALRKMRLMQGEK